MRVLADWYPEAVLIPYHLKTSTRWLLRGSGSTGSISCAFFWLKDSPVMYSALDKVKI